MSWFFADEKKPTFREDPVYLKFMNLLEKLDSQRKETFDEQREQHGEKFQTKLSGPAGKADAAFGTGYMRIINTSRNNLGPNHGKIVLAALTEQGNIFITYVNDLLEEIKACITMLERRPGLAVANKKLMGNFQNLKLQVQKLLDILREQGKPDPENIETWAGPVFTKLLSQSKSISSTAEVLRRDFDALAERGQIVFD